MVAKKKREELVKDHTTQNGGEEKKVVKDHRNVVNSFSSPVFSSTP